MNNLVLYVYDINLNRIGIIDNFERIEIKNNYYSHSVMKLTVEGNSQNYNLLLNTSDDLNNELRILVRSDDITRGYLIETVQLDDDRRTSISLVAYSLSIFMRWRVISGQKVYEGNVETIMKNLVSDNCISSSTERNIPRLVVSNSSGIFITSNEIFENMALDVALWELCRKFEITYEVTIDHQNKSFVFNVYSGVDRSYGQTVNHRVIFSKEFENVNNQSYTNDKYSYFNTPLTDGDFVGNYIGFNRRETYFNDNNENKIQNYQRVRTFESNINPLGQFSFKRDYFLGDIISNVNKELGIIVNNRVVVATENFNRNGYSLVLEFGTGIPSFIDKIKKEVK